jgi:hypothetical protein
MKLRFLVLLVSLSVVSLLAGACGSSSDEGTGAQPDTSSGQGAQTARDQAKAEPTATLVTGARKVPGTIQFAETSLLSAESDIAAHLGEETEVCGYVAEVIYERDAEGRPTYLRFDNPSPDQTFTVLIEGKRRPRWSNKPENYYPTQVVCAKGTIVDIQGGPGMIIDAVYNLVNQGGGAGPGISPSRQQREEERKAREAAATKEAK